MLDGFLARKFKITSEKGVKIDSIADIVFILVSIIKILPVLNLSKVIYIWVIVIAMIIQCIDLVIVEILTCVLATFSAIQEGHYIRTRKI